MNGSGNQLFPRTGLAENENRRIRDGHLPDIVQNPFQWLALADDDFKTAQGVDLFAQVFSFGS